jgi:hypothetical protein
MRKDPARIRQAGPKPSFADRTVRFIERSDHPVGRGAQVCAMNAARRCDGVPLVAKSNPELCESGPALFVRREIRKITHPKHVRCREAGAGERAVDANHLTDEQRHRVVAVCDRNRHVDGDGTAVP